MKMPPAPQPRPVVIDPAMVEVFARNGARFVDPHEAAALWNSAMQASGPERAPLVVSLLAAGATIAAVDDVVTQLCGPPPTDAADPFAHLPDWAVALFKRLGVIAPPVPEVDPNAPPKPVESRAELAARAAAAGIVLG